MNTDNLYANVPLNDPQRPRQTWRSWPFMLTGGLLGVIGLYIIIVLGLAYIWCHQPETFEVADVIAADAHGADGHPVPGSALVTTAIRIGETLLDKPGGFLYNDIAPPGVFLDNCPSWECGTLMALRDFVRSLRNDFSRSQRQSFENEDIKKADMQLAINPESWLFPAAEEEYRKAIDSLRRYLTTLSAEQSQEHFFARADNLAQYLDVIAKRLGHQGSRLSASVADPALMRAFASPAETDPDQPAGSLTANSQQTPWNEVDNVFYCTRGYSWALLHIMQAIALDFRGTLETKNGQILVDQIIGDLRGAIKSMSSPIILNGDGYGILANHSLTIASYIARVNASVLDLKILLEDG